MERQRADKDGRLNREGNNVHRVCEREREYECIWVCVCVNGLSRHLLIHTFWQWADEQRRNWSQLQMREGRGEKDWGCICWLTEALLTAQVRGGRTEGAAGSIKCKMQMLRAAKNTKHKRILSTTIKAASAASSSSPCIPCCSHCPHHADDLSTSPCIGVAFIALVKASSSSRRGSGTAGQRGKGSKLKSHKMIFISFRCRVMRH